MINVNNAIDGFEVPIIAKIYTSTRQDGESILTLAKTIKYMGCVSVLKPSDLKGNTTDYNGKDMIKIHTKTKFKFPLQSIIVVNKKKYKVKEFFDYSNINGGYYKYFLEKNG